MNLLIRSALFALFTGLAGVAAAQAQPSYSCGGNLTGTERAICDDVQLSRLDVAMASLYQVMMEGRSGDRYDVARAAQLQWQRTRNACGADTACLRRSYIEHIATLTRQIGQGGSGPLQRAADVSVLPDGTIVKRRSDGTTERRGPDGKVRLFRPDGTEIDQTRTAMVEVQKGGLPELPDGLSQWGDQLNYRLESILRNLLTETEFAAYQATERDKAFYDLIDWRSRSITYLTAAR